MPHDLFLLDLIVNLPAGRAAEITAPARRGDDSLINARD
jgi:hypothetical protein